MYRVAICDDESYICSQIEEIIINYQKESLEEIDIEVFYSGEELCRFIQQEHNFDIIFLDIELKQMNGVEIGRIIREDMSDEVTQLLYISSKQDYAMTLFDNRPLNFLIKPLDQDKVVKYLSQAIQISQKSNLFYEFNVGKIHYKVPYKDIMYFESDDKKIRVITNTVTYECYGKLTDMKEVVPSSEFFFIHKSYLVNYLYISEAQYEFVKVTSGIILPISQTYRKEVRDMLIKRRKGRR